jgi:hypothetical protein
MDREMLLSAGLLGSLAINGIHWLMSRKGPLLCIPKSLLVQTLLNALGIASGVAAVGFLLRLLPPWLFETSVGTFVIAMQACSVVARWSVVLTAREKSIPGRGHKG